MTHEPRWKMQELSHQFVVAAKGRRPNIKIVYGTTSSNAPLFGTKEEARQVAIIIERALNDPSSRVSDHE